jgi:hypothetical protein
MVRSRRCVRSSTSSPGGADAALPDGGPSPDASTDASAEAGARGELAYAWQVFYDRSFAAHVEVDSLTPDDGQWASALVRFAHR